MNLAIDEVMNVFANEVSDFGFILDLLQRTEPLSPDIPKYLRKKRSQYFEIFILIGMSPTEPPQSLPN
jgi:hypothetical protein